MLQDFQNKQLLEFIYLPKELLQFRSIPKEMTVWLDPKLFSQVDVDPTPVDPTPMAPSPTSPQSRPEMEPGVK